MIYCRIKYKIENCLSFEYFNKLLSIYNLEIYMLVFNVYNLLYLDVFNNFNI